MINSIVMGIIEVLVIIFCMILFYRVESSYKKNRSQTYNLWLMVIISQTIVVYILSFIRLILISLIYDLSSITNNVYFIIGITHTLFIFSFPAFIHSILGLPRKCNIPFLVFLIVNILYILSNYQMTSSNNELVMGINNILSTFINITHVTFVIYLILIILLTKKSRREKKMVYLSSGILIFHIIYSIYFGFIFKQDSFITELSNYSIVFWISLPRDIYMIVIFYMLFFNQSENIIELTVREREILDLLIDRKRSKEIAHKLNISLSTVNSHIYKIYKKKGVTSRKELLELK